MSDARGTTRCREFGPYLLKVVRNKLIDGENGRLEMVCLNVKSLRLPAKRIALLFGGVVAGLLLAECLLRVMGVSYPLPYMPDAHLGTRLQPGFRAWFHKEGHAFVRVNRAGFRDRDHTRKKPPGTFRIVVLGDSYAEAFQVSEEDAFWSVLKQRLGECDALSGKSVEVLNFGVSGYGTAQELLAWRHYARDYEPDLVLLAVTTGNDVRNNFEPLEPVKVRPFFHLNEGELVLDNSFQEHSDYRKALSAWTKRKVGLINGSRVLQVLNEIRNNRHAEAVVGSGEAGLDDMVYIKPTDDSWQGAWDLTEAILTQLHRETDQEGCRFVVTTLTSGIQVHPDPAIREEYQSRLGVEDLLYPGRRIRTLGGRVGFPVINLAEPMRKIAEQEGVFLHGFENTVMGEGHWNRDGHRAAGRLLAESICRLLSE